MHDIKQLKTLKGNENLANCNGDLLVEQNDDLLLTDITPIENNGIDLLTMDVPVMSNPTSVPNQDNIDLFAVDIQLDNTAPVQIEPIQK